MQLLVGRDDGESTRGARLERTRTPSEVERAWKQPSPRRGRPALREGEPAHVVVPVVIPLQLVTPGDLGRCREHLERDATLHETRHVDVPTIAPPQEIPAPQE